MSSFAIDGIYHLSHCVGDLPAASRWYREILGGHRFLENHSEEARRDAGFWVVAGEVWELLAPAAVAGADDAPIGRFNRRYGDRLHSLSWWVDDLPAWVAALEGAGIRSLAVAGGPCSSADARNDFVAFTHPADTYGMIEMAGPDCTPECRAPAVPDEGPHPLGLERVERMVVLVHDLDAAVPVLRGVLGATVGGELEVPRRSRSVVLDVGPSRLEVRSPVAAGDERDWIERNGEGPYTVTFGVRDRDAAAAHLHATGHRTSDRADGSVVVHPDDAFGVPFEFAPARPFC